jgi:hypothetical protein
MRIKYTELRREFMRQYTSTASPFLNITSTTLQSYANQVKVVLLARTPDYL